MKTFFFRHVLLIAGGIIGLALLAFPASAQEANKVQELQRVICLLYTSPSPRDLN